jgi:tetratricopeptide (TPR) repeat protein
MASPPTIASGPPSGTPSGIPLTLPASLIRIWADRHLLESAAETVLATPGVQRLRENLFAVLPIPADPGEIDVAAGCGERLLRSLGPAAATDVRVVVLPGQVILGQTPRVESDALLRDLDQQPPQVPGGEVYLTGHAARRIEGLCRLEPCGRYEGPSGSLAPLWVIHGLRDNPRPWTNPQLLGREPAYVPRPVVEKELARHRTAAAVRVVGPLGSGKTRLLWQALGEPRSEAGSAAAVEAMSPTTGWLTGASPRSGSPDLVTQLLRLLLTLHQQRRGEKNPAEALRQLHLEAHRGWLLDDPLYGDRPPTEALTETVLNALMALRSTTGATPARTRLIFDDLHLVTPAELELLADLVQAPSIARDYRLVLAGRPSTRWPQRLEPLPKIGVPPMTEEEMAALATSLFRGLRMPEAVTGRLLEAAAGYPLALEEGLARMIQSKHLRANYGNFFFTGDPAAEYEPSARLIQYLEAETGGGDRATVLRLLALAEGPVPPSELAAAAALYGAELPIHWETPLLGSGWLRPEESPWGPGVTFACPAYRRGLERTIAATAVPEVRHTLGELLGHASDQPQARWQAYSLMSGTSEAISPILELAKNAGDEIPQDEIFEGLHRELEGHRQRGGDAATELRMLWILIPLARRVGRLKEVQGEIQRALELAADDPQRLLAFASLQAELATAEGRFQEGEAALRGALELVLKADPGRQALVLTQLGHLLLRQERFREAQALFDQLLRTLEQRRKQTDGASPLAGWIATCRFHLGNIALRRGRLDEALALHQQALAERRREGKLRAVGISLSAVGTVFLNRGDYPRALAHCREAESLLRAHGKEADLSYALLGVGRTLRRLGDFTSAMASLRRALELREQSPDVVGEAMARLTVAANELSLGRAERALAEARKAHFRLSLIPEVGFLGHVERLLGRIHMQQRHWDVARTHLEAALNIHGRHGEATAALEDQSWLLELALAEHEGEEIRLLCRGLLRRDPTLTPERPEMLDLSLYRGLEWLRHAGAPEADPLTALRRAYAQVMGKAALLQPEQRHHFLAQIADNAAILAAATEHHLEAPGGTESRDGADDLWAGEL